MQLIDLPNEILLHVTQYLNFKDKINFGRICNKSFLKFYNFDNLEYTLHLCTFKMSIFINYLLLI